MTKTSGAKMLEAWICSGGRKRNWYAREHPVHIETLRDWLQGKAIPIAANRNRIEALTNGAVPADSWVTDRGNNHDTDT